MSRALAMVALAGALAGFETPAEPAEPAAAEAKVEEKIAAAATPTVGVEKFVGFRTHPLLCPAGTR